MNKYLRLRPPIYEVQELLGQGLSGCVYRATRRDMTTQLEHEVAIKVLNSRNLVEIWREEFRSLSRVRSPRCVRVLGFDWVGRKPALILELVHGVTLAELIRQLPIDEAEARWIGGEIALGLRELGQQNLCHGDLSLNNVMVDRDGGIRLLDFGLGNSFQGGCRVTPAFAAPEVLSGHPVNERADLFSLGQILLRLGVTGNDLPELACLLDANPEMRKWPDQLNRPLPPSSLVIKVERLLAWKKSREGTRDLSLGASSPRAPRWRALALGFLFIGSGIPAGRSATPELETIVRVRSAQGLEVEWNGRIVGYAPLDLRHLSPGKHQLKVRVQGRTRVRALTLRSGDHILVDDHWLTAPSNREF